MKLKNFIKSFLIAVLLMSPLLTSAQAFKPATLYKLGHRIAVYSQEQANRYFKSGYQLEKNNDQMLGITIPIGVANFETSLVSPINSTATSSMVLVSGTTDDGTTLNGTYGFVIDSGASNQEYVLATCVDTSCSNLVRGISVVTGNTSVTALKQSHRRGASVKITDHPLLITLARILNGQETTPGGLTFGTNALTGINNLVINGSLTGITVTPSSSATTSAANVQYVNNAVVAGGVDASSVSKGITYLSSNSSSSTLPIALNSEEVSTTTGANKVVRSSSTGLINPNFIDGSGNYTFSGNDNFTGTTTLNNINVTGTSTFSVSPIIIAKGSYDYVTSASVSTTTITYNLNAIPYLITFDYFISNGANFRSIGNGKYTTGSSTLTYTDVNNSSLSNPGISNSLVTHYFNNSINCDGSINPTNVGTSTALINYTACNDGTLSSKTVYWTAFGIRK